MFQVYIYIWGNSVVLCDRFPSISVLEFIYAQSPESMKGLLTGLFYFLIGVTSIPSSALYYLYKTSVKNKVLLPFHAAFIILMVGTSVCKAVTDTFVYAGGGHSVLCCGCHSSQQQTEKWWRQSPAETDHWEPVTQHSHWEFSRAGRLVC